VIAKRDDCPSLHFKRRTYVGIKQVSERVWLVGFMRFDLGFFDDETCRIESAENPFDAKVLPMCPE